MAFTEQDLKNQQQEIARLAEELGQLNQMFAEQKKVLGFDAEAEVTVDAAEMTPELEQAMADAKAEAEREGRARAASAKADAPAPSAASCRRRGMRI
ncbi:MAG: hypothetical protein IJ474_03875 [Mailhella sp.]|nr:hypothetical protein [Mailhella sp.]MBQ9105383.1 hypothetical protein [Mailhella sp.]